MLNGVASISGNDLWKQVVGVIAITSGGFVSGGNRFLAMGWHGILRHPNHRTKIHPSKYVKALIIKLIQLNIIQVIRFLFKKPLNLLNLAHPHLSPAQRIKSAKMKEFTDKTPQAPPKLSQKRTLIH
jgi:hypothetical protein